MVVFVTRYVYVTCIIMYVPYSAKRWRGKTLVNRSFQSFGEENVGEFNLLTNS